MELDYWLIFGFGGVSLCYVLMAAAKKIKESTLNVPLVRGTDTNVQFVEFKRKTAAEPNNPKHWVHWGNALVLSARQGRNTNMKVHRYNEACACYAHAVEVSSTYTPAWISWGITLYELFRVQKCTDIFQLEGGHNKFRTALEQSPSNPLLWTKWGEELGKVAACLTGDQRKGLVELSQECLAKAAELATSTPSGKDMATALLEIDEPTAAENNAPAAPAMVAGVMVGEALAAASPVAAVTTDAATAAAGSLSPTPAAFNLSSKTTTPEDF